MRIGIDATSWHNHRGYGRHARALIRELVRLDGGNRYTLFIDTADGAEALPGNAEVKIMSASRPAAEAASSNGRRSLSDMWKVSRQMSREPLDILLFPTIYTYVPVFTRARKIVVIHDVIAEKFPELTLPRRSARLFWNLKVGAGRRQADALVTVSEYSRRQIVEHFRVSPEAVFVVGEAGDPVFREIGEPVLPPAMRALAGRRLITYVGGFSPHKNLDMLVTAFGALAGRPEFSDTTLVMVGETQKETFHSYFGSIAAQVEALGLNGRVRFPGYMADDDLAHLLNLSAVTVLPSKMEGFGLPAVEAAACGCPVIATTASPLPELLGDGALCIDPETGRLREALETVLASPELRARMGKAGACAAARLSWNAAARQMIEVMRKVAP